MSCASTGSPARSLSTIDRPTIDRPTIDRPTTDRPTTDRRRGFTLLEVLVAFAVLAVALGVAFEIFATGLRGARSADALTRAVLIADSRLARVGIETELTPGRSEGETGDGTRWRVDIQEHPAEEGDDERVETPSLPVLLDVIVTVSWREAAGRQSFVLRTSRLAPGEFD